MIFTTILITLVIDDPITRRLPMLRTRSIDSISSKRLTALLPKYHCQRSYINYVACSETRASNKRADKGDD